MTNQRTSERPAQAGQPAYDDKMARSGSISDYSDVPRRRTPRGTFVSLYSGAGGLDLGFAFAGFAPVWVNDFDAQATETNERTFKRLRDDLPHLRHVEHETVTGSILDIIDNDCLPARGAADLVIGGPPCQGFSVAGKMDPTDTRSQHVFRFFDVVNHVQPTAFVMENVKALYENQRWTQIRDGLVERAQSLGYTTMLTCLNASHFGVPQARERMVLIGIKGGSPVPPAPTTAETAPTVREAFEQIPHFGAPGNDIPCTAKITAARTPVMRKSPFAGMLFNGAGRPMDAEAPSMTLPASMGGNKTPIVDQQQLDDGGDSWIVEYHRHLMAGGAPADRIPARMRRITVAEAAALQTFPIDVDWAGPQSAQYRQIGNAVPPRLGLAIGLAVADALNV